jgi:hypothetical protein
VFGEATFNPETTGCGKSPKTKGPGGICIERKICRIFPERVEKSTCPITVFKKNLPHFYIFAKGGLKTPCVRFMIRCRKAQPRAMQNLMFQLLIGALGV